LASTLQIKGLIAAAVIFAVLGCAARGAGSELPELRVKACQAPPKIDGKLGDACWENAAAIKAFYIYRGGGRTTPRNTVYLTRDNEWLYLAFNIKLPHPDYVRPQFTRHDEGVHKDDSVEIFLDPGTEGKVYFHYMLNVVNARAEQRVIKSGKDRGWDVPWRSAVKLTDTGWRAELALPLYVMMALGDVSKARMNIAINRVIPTIDPQGVRVGEGRDASTWSPVDRQYHEPWSFGHLRGLEGARPKTPFLAATHDVKVGRYYLKEKSFCYDVTGSVQSYTPASGSVALEMIDQPVTGKPESFSEQIQVAGGTTVPFKLTVPVTSLVERTGRFVMKDPATGEVLQSVILDEMASLSLMKTYADRSYYTTEKQAVIVCEFGVPEDTLQGTVLLAEDSKGTQLGKIPEVGPVTNLPINIEGLGVGVEPLRVQLCGKNGEQMLSQTVSLIKRAPKPGVEWKIDRINRRLLHDGEPFFPYGLVMYAMVAGRDDAQFRQVSELGFNTVQRWYNGADPNNPTEYHKTAAKYGMYVVDAIERYARGNMISSKGDPNFTEIIKQNMPRMEMAIRNMKDSPHLIAYSGFDEPVANQVTAGRLLYARIHELDGYHPKKVLYSSHIPKGEQFTDWCDILATDPYWTPGNSGDRGNINFVSMITHITHERGENGRKVTWIFPFGELWSGIRKRAILPKEQFCQTYLAIIHGAKGIFYFRWPFWHQQPVETFRALGKQMRLIGPIAVTEEIPQTITYKPIEFALDERKFPEVQVSLRHNPAGGYVLLAANSRCYPVDVTYRISILGGEGKIGRLFDSAAAYPVKDGGFSDRLDVLDTRAYTFGAADIKGPVSITVEAVGHPEETDKLYGASALPVTGRVGKRNIVRNPGFEENSLPGWPDYYMIGDGGPRLGEPGKQAEWGLDPKNPHEGKYSLRVKEYERNRPRRVASVLAPQLDKATPFVISAYMRADKPGAKVKFFGGGYRVARPTFGKKTFTLTTKWRRYSEVGVLPGGLGRYHSIGVDVLKANNATVWIDALQLEKGEQPTAFEP